MDADDMETERDVAAALLYIELRKLVQWLTESSHDDVKLCHGARMAMAKARKSGMVSDSRDRILKADPRYSYLNRNLLTIS